jgi:hypothetical protein
MLPGQLPRPWNRGSGSNRAKNNDNGSTSGYAAELTVARTTVQLRRNAFGLDRDQ